MVDCLTIIISINICKLVYYYLILIVPGLFVALITCYILNSLVSMLIFETTDLVSSYVIAN